MESVFLRYDRVRGQLFHVRGKQSTEIPLTSREYKLISYMIEQNRHAVNNPVFCTNEDLIEAVYAYPSMHRVKDQTVEPGLDDLRHLVHRLRRKLEVNPQKPQFLITHPGGYLLYIYPHAQ